ncbi:MFS transporter [Roseomonas marmotae]|uniref:MFS transporter n=1 Tax=Roseomonas marmotae TaxID=2768161 RepID=A0ABS3KAD0_9PROT|nr:MFS transporter [Roseomonas marmotae]MBO1074429.1 MFS transporter [Roseomonas marmotae]QTI78166.1 MFS transporter [Roseomonas marmotae]
MLQVLPPAPPKATWTAALGTTLLMQTVAAFMGQMLPVLAPVMTRDAGLRPENVGHFAALNAVGVVIFLIFGGPLLKRMGPVRSLQGGAVLAGLGLAVAMLGSLPALLLASLLLGIGYGPTPPAGSRILAATAPPRHRTLIFSIKQAGAPLGASLAGLAAAPLAVIAGWQASLWLGIGAAVVACCLVQPQRAMLDVERDPGQPIGFGTLFSLGSLAGPFTALRLHRLLPPLTLLAFSFAIVQGSLFAFTVTWITEARGLALVQAGTAFAGMQAGGAVARIGLGWLADRTGRPALALVVQAMAAALLVAVLTLLPLDAPFWLLLLLCTLTGGVAASWNGIYNAEVARLVPPERVIEATAGSSTLCFLGCVLAPAAFAVLVAVSGGWTLPLLLASGQLAVTGAIVLLPVLRASRAG